MELVLTLAFWLHFVGLAAGGAASMGIPVIGAAMDRATPEQIPLLGDLAMRLSKVGRIGIGLLVLSGVVMIWGEGSLAFYNNWFWFKLVLVAVLIAAIVFASRNGRKALAGDARARALAPRLGALNLALLLLILLAAVLSFG